MNPIILPVVLGLVGSGAGIGAGFVLRPPPPAAEAPDCAQSETACPEDPAPPEPATSYSYYDLNDQFVVPVMGERRVISLVVLTLTIETDPDTEDRVSALEPKLRDALLQALFDHAQTGGFDGVFTTGQPMRDLRQSLTSKARTVLGDMAHGVLVTDIIRQDL